MGLIAAALLTIVLFVYIFWPDHGLARQTEKTRVDYLVERKEVIYDNLRDLKFEYLAGKHPEEDYNVQRSGLEDEAEGVLLEIDTLEGTRGLKQKRMSPDLRSGA